MLIENKIADVLSRLSLEETPDLEQEFQNLLAQKKKIEAQHNK